VLAAGHNGKAELAVVVGRLIEIVDGDDQVIDALKHSFGPPEFII
jgi:hypothetical protein